MTAKETKALIDSVMEKIQAECNRRLFTANNTEKVNEAFNHLYESLYDTYKDFLYDLRDADKK